MNLFLDSAAYSYYHNLTCLFLVSITSNVLVIITTIMKSSTLAVIAAVLASSTTTAFQATSPLLSITHHSSSSSSTTTTLYEYIPSGFTKQSWAEFKKKEAAAKKANLGRVGPKGFQSRSMQSFQEALERGEAEHLLPVFNAKEKVAKGLLKVEDIPYMQRGES